jgi:hypothetical protein
LGYMFVAIHCLVLFIPHLLGNNWSWSNPLFFCWVTTSPFFCVVYCSSWFHMGCNFET